MIHYHIGIDPSLTSTGLAMIAVEAGRIIRFDSTHLKTKPAQTIPEELARMRDVRARVERKISDWECALVASYAMEGASYASVHGKQWERGGLWWSVYGLVHDISEELPVIVPPTALKKAVSGNGNAAKSLMKESISGFVDSCTPGIVVPEMKQNDEIDALGLAIVSAIRAGHIAHDTAEMIAESTYREKSYKKEKKKMRAQKKAAKKNP